MESNIEDIVDNFMKLWAKQYEYNLKLPENINSLLNMLSVDNLLENSKKVDKDDIFGPANLVLYEQFIKQINQLYPGNDEFTKQFFDIAQRFTERGAENQGGDVKSESSNIDKTAAKTNK